MNAQQLLAKMIPPAGSRPSKPYRGGVIQVWVTRACDKACYGCTQGSNLRGLTPTMTPEQYATALDSLKGYWGVVGMFGGNPATHPEFEELCRILRGKFPKEQCGIWSNNPFTAEKARVMRETFNPAVSNLNVHLDRKAYDTFMEGWPEARVVGLTGDSRHSPPYVALKDVIKKPCPTCYDSTDERKFNGGPEECPTCGGFGVVYDAEKGRDLISTCDINARWSAMIGVFRGGLRAWFCEIAGAQSILHQDDWAPCPDCESDSLVGCKTCDEGPANGRVFTYPDTGIAIPPRPGSHMGYYEYQVPGMLSMFPMTAEYWWQLPMVAFAYQVEKHCHECGVPLRGYGELSQAADDRGKEQVSRTHATVYEPKRKGRRVELVTLQTQLGMRLDHVTDYLQNGRK